MSPRSQPESVTDRIVREIADTAAANSFDSTDAHNARARDLRAAGRELRKVVPRKRHAEFERSPAVDPLRILTDSNRGRLPELIPVRQARMSESAFAFYRATADLMAADLSRTPTTGVEVQLCGDAHLMNFGLFASPERAMRFDVNDFDETAVGPWEWDVKRLAASTAVAAASGNHDGGLPRQAARAAASAYRQVLRALVELSPLVLWPLSFGGAALVDELSTKKARKKTGGTLERATARTSIGALNKLTAVEQGRRVIVEDPPLIVHELDGKSGREVAARAFERYIVSLPPEREALLRQYRLVDSARKVVGVGSVGTHCYILLLEAERDGSPLFLQIKEAQASVLEPYISSTPPRPHGHRVYVGQRLMQVVGDPFLGTFELGGLDFYVRQLWDYKASAKVDKMGDDELLAYAEICGATLARAHARSPRAPEIAAYLGDGTAFDDAVAEFSVDYTAQTVADHKLFCAYAEPEPPA